MSRRNDERVADVRIDDERLTVDLMDGRTIAVPLAWYPRLLAATPDQRNAWECAGGGYGIHWPELDEDLSTEGLLRGAPARRCGGLRAAPSSPLEESVAEPEAGMAEKSAEFRDRGGEVYVGVE